MPMLVMLKEHTLPGGEVVMVPDRYVRASDFNGKLGQANNPEWKTVAFDESGKVVLPNGAIGFRWGPDGRADQGQWNLEAKEARHGNEVKLKLSVLEGVEPSTQTAKVGFPYFGGIVSEHFPNNKQSDVLVRTVPVQRIALGKEGEKREALVATVFDLQVANYGVARGLPGELAATSFDDDTPYTPAWQERITGTPRAQLITVARQFAENAHKTHGKSMVIIGAAMNHWYHSDMNYRGVINMLMMCGCIGQSGGGWAHYVGQEKLRPQTGWTALAFALDWIRPPRQMNSTSFFYAHTDQWRYEKLGMEEVISPLADKKAYAGSMIDYNVRAERMGWLPSAPQLQTNPLQVVRDAQAADVDPKEYAVKALKDGTLKMSCTDPDHPDNWPRNMFVWRSNLLGSSGKGHEYFLKHLLGTSNGVQGKDLGVEEAKPTEVVWHEHAPEGKLDLLVTLDFRMSTTCLYSDIVLPTATWYEKNDLNTSDMHPFIHPLSTAVDPAWQSRSDWEIYKGFAKKFSEVCVGHLGVERELVLTPLMHDSPSELAQPFEVKDWKRGECELIPGKTAPNIAVVERDYPNVFKRFTALGPLMAKAGNGGKGIAWNTQAEVKQLGELSGLVTAEGATCGMPKIETDIDACEVILQLAPETNGHVAVKAWQALGKQTGLDHSASCPPSRGREDTFPRHPGTAAQDHQFADVERHRERDSLVQRRLHECARADSVANAHRAAAVLHGPPVDDRVWRGLLELSAAGGPEDDRRHPRHQAERQRRDRAQLHHAAPEVGHPLDLHGQPADAHAEPRWSLRVAERGRRQARRNRGQRLDRVVQHQWRDCGTRRREPARQSGHGDDVPRAGEDREHARLGNHRGARRHPQLGDAHRAEAHAHDRRLRAVQLRLQLLRDHRHQPRRVRRRAQDEQGRLARHAGGERAHQGGAGGRRSFMKIRAQIGMVLNLDKCIGCHTCSVTCKNVWTSRPGMEYAWFNNVETKPGIGYPKEWENQDKWNGGWVRNADGSIQPRQGAKWKLLMRIFANPNLPQIDDYYEPFTFDYGHLQSAPEMKATPTARPRSLITGKQMDKIVWGPNWEEILGGEFAKRSKDTNFDEIQKEMYGQFENTFMMYLPRLCEHCLNPACVASCPSGSIYKREEDGIVLIDQDKCRGWRMCVSGCPYKKIYYNWKSGKAEKCIFCYPRIEAGQPTVCSETCVGRIRYLGVLLYDADRIQEAASVEHDRDLYQAQLDIFLDPFDPKVIAQAVTDGIPDKWMEAARASPVYKMAVQWKVALPLHPEYRTLPMVWYVPPLSPISAAANAGHIGSNGEIPDVHQLRIPVKYLANLLTAGDTQPVVRALERMLAMRAYQREKHVDGRVNQAVLKQVGITQAEVEDMYHVMAIANYEDRFVIPSTHREYAENTFNVRGGCGFSFGDGCSEGTGETSLFGSEKKRTIPIRAEV